ncbi:PSTK-like protein, partial [Mya arenaria]
MSLVVTKEAGKKRKLKPKGSSQWKDYRRDIVKCVHDTLSYCQVYVKVAMETSLHRNSIREVKVRDDTIVSMATRFEIPDPAVNTWEVNSVTVESGQDRNSEVIVQLIHQSLEEPVQPIQEVDEEESNQSRVICSKNFLHQADQILRRLVTQEMQCVKEKSMSKQEVRKHAESVQSSRRQVLDNLKAEEVCIPEHLIAMATDSSKNADSPAVAMAASVLAPMAETMSANFFTSMSALARSFSSSRLHTTKTEDSEVVMRAQDDE